ncbi:MAG: hypothetical protein F6K24_57300, partial [Okeania sp. SIO2D1]|nr:hypothetical protein [Okeania sp. SIO2D1]
MPDKQKVTVYLSPGLHRQLKIRAAVDTESMSAMVEKAIVFYLEHPQVVEELDTFSGKTHQIHTCPECLSSLVIRDAQMVSLKDQPGVLADEIPGEKVQQQVSCRRTNSE